MTRTSPENDSTRPDSQITRNLVNYSIYMKNNGYAEPTITSRTRALKQLAVLTDLNDSEKVKKTITSQKWKGITKRKYSETYTALLKYLGLTWIKPHITLETRLPFIPTEAEIDQLIASCGKRTATLLQTLKETGIRISEAIKLKWIDLDIERRTLNITPSKNSNPRILPISNKLVNMLNELSHTQETLFATRIQGLRTTFNTQRKTAAKKLQNPRIRRISFHTFRHWKGTMEYHKTHDIMHVKQVLGHKSINNTLIYINLEQAIFLTDNDEWTCKAAHNVTEATQLIELGFEYITDMDGLKLFRKRK